jgi:predicted enzyme related to lactoylglutathione lyase
MANLNYLLVAVKDPLASAALYDQLFGVAPVERSKTFVLYVLPSGLKVGLWGAAGMTPAPKPAGGIELSFSLPDEASVRQTYAAWTKLGLAVVQEPTHLDFGFTFVVADPDGHRLRPFVLADQPR